MPERQRNVGRLFVIGGAEDPDEDDMKILPYFVGLCGGSSARIVVCGSPSEEPIEKECVYSKLFQKIGVADLYETTITVRADAERKEAVEMAQKATGVFFTGGDQLRLTSLIAGTPFGNIVRDRLWTDGLVVAGTSAGAAAMSSTMIIRGKSDASVRRADISLAPGLGYWRDATIDTHFAQRGRIARLLTVFAQNPQTLGIGLDENTAIDVIPGTAFTVVGAGSAFVFDGNVTHSSAPDAGYDGIIAMTDAIVHVLPEGYGFDLRTMRPSLPDGTPIGARGAAAE